MDNGLAIEVENLTKHYGQIRAVDHISFTVFQRHRQREEPKPS